MSRYPTQNVTSTGDVLGPASSTDNAVARWDGAGGTTIQNSGVIIDDSNNVSGIAAASVTTIELGHASDTTLSRSSAGVIAVEGVTVSLNSTSATHTAGTIELGAASDTTIARASAGLITVESVAVAMAGKQTIWVPASAMIAATTSGPASAQYESGTYDRNFKVLDFDASADEHAHFNVAFPKSWNLSTVTFQVWWMTSASVTTGVAWGLEGLAVSDNEDTDAAWGTAVVVTDTAQSAAAEVYVTAESSAVTIAGTPAAADVCYFRIFRDVSDAADNMTQDARLIGVKLFFTTSASTDA